MPKILFYTDTPIAGGAEKQMLLLADHLDKSNYQIQLVCSSFKSLDRWVQEFLDHGHRVTRLKVWHKHDPRHYFGLKKILKKERPDLLHIHVWNPASCRYAFWAAQKTHTKIIVTEHDPFVLRGFKNFLKKKFLRKTNEVIAVSESNRQFLLKSYPFLKERITTIHNGIDIKTIQKELLHFTNQEKKRIRHELFQSKNGQIILSIAALHPRKGLKYLLKAFAEVVHNFKDLKLVIVGEGPEQKELEKLSKNLGIDNKVVLLGYQQIISQLLKSSDLFVLPSIKEAFGLVLLEAMAVGVPIVATEVGGIPEIIQNHKNGELVEAANSKDLAEKIQELLKNTALREKLAFIGLHEVKKFSVEQMAKKTQEVYDKVLHSSL